MKRRALTMVAVVAMVAGWVWWNPGFHHRAHVHPTDMAYVPGGYFLMGSNDKDADEDVKPMRQVYVRGFYIDRTEVTNAQYRRVVKTHTYAPAQDDMPVTHVMRADAEAYLRAVGKRLPTSAEWEKAARGTDGRRYPWGNEFDTARAWVGKPSHDSAPNSTACALTRFVKVGSYPSGISPYGCLDMIGNAWEWVSDDYPSSPPRQIIRGGAYGYSERFLRTYAFSLEETGMT